MATSEQKNPSGNLGSWRNCTSLCEWDFCGKAARTTRIRNSASICTDMVINADVLILPAIQPTQVSDSLNKSRLYNYLGQLLMWLLVKKLIDGRNVSNHCQKNLNWQNFSNTHINLNLILKVKEVRKRESLIFCVGGSHNQLTGNY